MRPTAGFISLVRTFYQREPMMAANESGSDFLRSLEAGNRSALDQVCREYADRLLALAAREIGPRLEQIYPPSDAVQSALKSFCRQAANGRYHFDHEGAVWKLLQELTRRKIRRAGSIPKPGPLPEGELPGREPSPEEIVEHADAIQAFLARFTPRDKRILELWLEGFSSLKIAEEVGYSKWTVNRVTKRIRDWVDEHFDDGARASDR